MVANIKSKRSNAQKLLIVLIGLIFIYVIMTNFYVFMESYEVIKGVDTRYIILLPLLQLLSYVWIAVYYKTMFGIFNIDIKYINAYKMTAGLYFVEQVLPSGGASSVAYLAYGLRDKASFSLTSLVQLGRYGFNHLAYVFLVSLGVVWSLPLNNMRTTLFGLGLAVGVLISALIGFYLILSSDKHVNAVVTFIVNKINYLAKKLFKKDKLLNLKTILNDLKDFNKGAQKVKEDKLDFVKPLIIMTLSACSQVAVVYFSFMALDQQTNLSIIVFAFTFANVFGVLSVIPGDVGVHEGAMITALGIMGVDFSVALSATLIYRVFNKFIMVAIGFFFYSHFLKPKDPSQLKAS